jgi:23S rRNA (cytosine1962-C5)-methyltransferase
MSLSTLRLDSKLEPALASGHPWVYRNHLPPHALRPGDWVRLEAGRAAAVGRYDADGAIGVRLFDWDGAVPDREWLRERVRSALALRRLVPADTDAYRLLNGEGDGLPGVVADRYGRFVVMKHYAPSLAALLPDVAWAIAREVKVKGVLWRREGGLEALHGELPPPEITVREHGLSFIANLYHGQKTGLFLDQRDNRQTVRALAAGRSVLNLFSYSGMFSVYALAGGAKSARSVDVAAAALHDAERNAALNGVADAHETVQADVFAALQALAEAGERFGMVIVDPPSLGSGKVGRHAALRAYERLNAAALRCVEAGGLLVSSSCTAQVSPADFLAVLARGAQSAGVRAQVVHEAGQPADHPVPLAFPEGRYLKFVVLRVG